MRANGVTELGFHVMYDDHVIPLHRLFTDLNLDAVYSLGTATSKPLWDYQHNTYAYVENVPITIFTVDPIGTNEGTKSRWMCEAELRRIVETNFGGSLGVLRRFESLTPNTMDMGGWKLYSVKYNLEYKRANPNFTPTVPTVSWDDRWIYDGDHVTGAIEGTWAETENGNTGTFQPLATNNDWLDLNISASSGSKIYYVQNGTALALSTTLYPYVRVRWTTSSGSIKAGVKAVYSDASTSTILADTAGNNAINVTTATLTPGKTLNYIQLYANNATGDAYYDFVELFAGTYTFPNCTQIKMPKLILKDANLFAPWAVGNVTQALGAESSEITTVHDLDMEPAALTWKRAQASTKTDYNNDDIFTELHQENASTQPWHWLNLGGRQFKARLINVEPDYNGVRNTVSATWREYVGGSVASELYTSRFNMS